VDRGPACPAAKGNGDVPAQRCERVRGAIIMLEQYLPILLFILVGLTLGAVLLTVGTVLSPNRPDPEKLSPYECGFEAFEDARMKFDVRYYLVAILFILFDLEIAFLFPWAVVLPEIGLFGYVAMMVFLLVLVVGFVYEWKKGALEWE
jgi:NADH-quinone oxidoreductase subunit A